MMVGCASSDPVELPSSDGPGGPLAASAAGHAARVAAAETYAKACISGHDSSHDWWHVDRVRNSAVSLARQEGLLVRLTGRLVAGAQTGPNRYQAAPRALEQEQLFS